MHAYLHVYIHAYMYAYMHTDSLMCLHIYPNTQACTLACLATQIHTNIHGDLSMTDTERQTTEIYANINTYEQSCMFIYIFTCTYTPMHVWLHPFIYMLHRGVFRTIKVSCLCSWCHFLNDGANYQLNLMCIY